MFQTQVREVIVLVHHAPHTTAKLDSVIFFSS